MPFTFTHSALLLAILYIVPLKAQQAQVSADPSSNSQIRLSSLYNGPEYLADQVLYNDGTPMYHNDWKQGWLQYDGAKYFNVQLLYNVARDEVVLKHYDSSFRIQLIKSRVDSFQLEDKKFIQVRSSFVSDIPAGFYEVIHEGKEWLLKRNLKINQQVFREGMARVDVFDRHVYYLVKDAKGYRVNSKRSFLQLINKPGIDGILRRQDINYRSSPETYMKAALSSKHQSN